MLSALLGAAEDLLRRGIVVVEFLRDGFPIEVCELLDCTCGPLIVDDGPEQIALLCAPATVGEVGLADAQPLEHTVSPSHPRDQLCYSFPIILP